MVLLARTTPIEEVKKKSEGLSLFMIDLHRQDPGLEIKKIKKMGGRAVDANQVFFDNYRVPANTLIGNEGQGFKIVLHGMNAERCLLAGEALGLGYIAIKKAAQYAKERVVFDRPIGMNQSIQHPLATAYMNLEAAKLATYHAARLFDQSKVDSSITQHAVGVACNTAKYLAAEAGFTACERAVCAFSSFVGDFADIVRSCLTVAWAMLRNTTSSDISESALYRGWRPYHGFVRTATVFRSSLIRTQEMIMSFVAEKVLDLPRSY